MAPDVATTLGADRRAVVAHALLDSLRDADEQVEAAWRAEVVRRLDAVRSGAVELVDADDHYAQLRASLAEPV